jgi:hypothetical protein
VNRRLEVRLLACGEFAIAQRGVSVSGVLSTPLRLTRAHPMQKVRMYPDVPRELTKPALAAHPEPHEALVHAEKRQAADGIRTHDLLHGKQTL